MNNVTERIKLLKEKWKSQSKSRKIVFIIMLVGIISALIALKITINKNKYGILFSNMDSSDLSAVLAKLKEDKIDYKVEGNVIKVPKDKVDELRLEIPSEVKLSNGSVGFEIFDDNKFGMTDKEMNIEYQRALEGELERTIKSLPEVDDARVHIVMSDDSVFVRETNPAKASLTLKLKEGYSIDKDKVKAILELLCSSVKQLDKKDVSIIAYDGNNTKLLTTPDLFKDEDQNTVDTDEGQKIKNSVEAKLEDKIQTMLEKVYGIGNVVVKVNADLNFDAIQQKKVNYEPQGTVIKEHIITGTQTDEEANTGSPVDNQMVNQMDDENGKSISTNKDEERSYVVSSDEETIIKAPGAVQKITASVLLNGQLDDATKTSIVNLVSGVIGYNAVRGDSINVEGMQFDTSMTDKAKEDIEQMNNSQKNYKKLYTYSAIGGAALLALVILLIALKRAKNKKQKEEIEELLENNVEPKQVEQAPTVDLEKETEKSSIETQIKQYAVNKPDQVAEIVRAWLLEDER